MNGKILAILACVGFVSGCASSNNIKYKISSDPSNAQIDVNGVEMGKTPTEVSLSCSKQWVGLLNAPGGWANASGSYEVKAYPPKGFNGQSQVKRVDPCQWQGKESPSLKFDLALENVAPTQKIEIINTNNETKFEEAIKALQSLRSQGLITEEEYKEKILKLTK